MGHLHKYCIMFRKSWKFCFLHWHLLWRGFEKSYLILYIIIVISPFWLQVLKMIGRLVKQFRSTHCNCQTIPLIHLVNLDHHLNHPGTPLIHPGIPLIHQDIPLIHLGNHLSHLCNHLKPQGRNLEDLLIHFLQSIWRRHQRNHPGSLAILIHVILVTMPFQLSGGRCLSSKERWEVKVMNHIQSFKK